MSPSVSRITRNPVRTRVWSSARSTRILADILTIVPVPAPGAASSSRTTPGRNIVLAPDDDDGTRSLPSVASTHLLGRETNESHLLRTPATGLRAGRAGHGG